eukprot:1496929-Rhodomonas_salina.1
MLEAAPAAQGNLVLFYSRARLFRVDLYWERERSAVSGRLVLREREREREREQRLCTEEAEWYCERGVCLYQRGAERNVLYQACGTVVLRPEYVCTRFRWRRASRPTGGWCMIWPRSSRRRPRALPLRW